MSDTVAALVGFTRPIAFEGQAAMWLEHLARGTAAASTQFTCRFTGTEIDWRETLAGIIAGRRRGEAPDVVARAFHRSFGRRRTDSVLVQKMRVHRILQAMIALDDRRAARQDIEQIDVRRVDQRHFPHRVPQHAGEYFCDGITEDIITELSRLAALRVVSRTSAMQFRGRDHYDVHEIAKVLRVDMVVEGSVRRIGERVRIAARLINARSDEQVWAETYDRELTDIFGIQKGVALQVARALAPDLPVADVMKAPPPTADIDAYRLYLQGRHCVFQFTEHGIRRESSTTSARPRAIRVMPCRTRGWGSHS